MLGAGWCVGAGPGDVPSVLVVVGAPGEAEYRTNFLRQASAWSTACDRAAARHVVLDGPDASATPPLERLQSALAAEPREGEAPLWLVLVGHGTFDGRVAAMNLVGPDLTPGQLADWLQPFRRPVVVVDTTSASAPFLKALSATNRVVITATRSGFEQDFTRFGTQMADAIADPAADLDQDGQTSVLEAFLRASAQVVESYKLEGRLLTEHALVDDNGDGLGTPAEWFRGTRSTRRPKDGATLDGPRAHQLHLVRSPEDLRLSSVARERRDRLELEIAVLRERKAGMAAEAYYARLEALLRELAGVYPP